MRVFVGIDGGGTRATALATDERGRELARAEGAPGLVRQTDPAAGAPALAALTRRVLDDAGFEGRAAALCCALAGAGREPGRSRLERALASTGIARVVRVATDAEAALYDALDGGAGILVIAGTGSIGWGRAEDGRTGRVGGWGQILGDEGSGFALGLAALRATVRAHDGRGPATRLARSVLAATGVERPEALVGWAAAAAKGDVAALAPLAIEAAGWGDAVAEGIVEEAARELAGHAVALHGRLGPWSAPPPLALAGGLVLPGRPFRPAVERALERAGAEFRLLVRPVDAARGAAALARRAVEA